MSFAGCRASLIYMCLIVYEFSFILFIHHKIHFHFKLCIYCNILDINLLWNMNFVKYLLFYMKLLNYLFCNMFGRTVFDFLPTHPGNLMPMPGRPDILTQPLLRAPKPGITSQPQPTSQLNIGTQLTSRGRHGSHQTHAVACSLNFTSYNLKYITDDSAAQQYSQN